MRRDVLRRAVEFQQGNGHPHQKAYRDTWGVNKDDRERGVQQLDRYVKWFYETAALLYELLTENGTLYVHLDWHVSHYAKAVLDEVFGPEGPR